MPYNETTLKQAVKMIETTHIKANLEQIKNRIASINPDARLVAVSKTFSTELIRAALDAGQFEFGESKVQEALPKIDCFEGDERIRWHFIGHLQTNKSSKITGKFSLIQSADSFRIAEKISGYSLEKNIVQEILVELNPSDEEAKTGIRLDAAEGIIESIARLEGVKIAGLMAMAPYSEDPENARPYFRKAAALFAKLKNGCSMKTLSMGMSNDFEIALQEGATMVRVGTAIFGGRNYGG